MKKFMIDIESTGVEPEKDELLQIGLLELIWDGDFWRPGKSFLIHQHTDRQPTSEFAIKHQQKLYARCNAAAPIAVEEVQAAMVRFFEDCGVKTPNAQLMGWNASTFDVPFLEYHGYLMKSHYVTVNGKDTRVGTHHYRVDEIAGRLEQTMDVLRNHHRDGIKEQALALTPGSVVAEMTHDALEDCYQQLRVVNGTIKLLRKE